MQVSYNWLQSYFKKELPKSDRLAELLTEHIFEVESLEKVGTDFVLNVNVLPDRAHYCLSHRGIAHEIGAIINEKIVLPKHDATFSELMDAPRFSIEDRVLCRRYMGRLITDVSIKETPSWIRERLEAVGQRCINPIVDVTNYVLLDTGQPLHVFDADQVEGSIVVRPSRAGEHIILLDGRRIELDESVLVIADAAGPLVIAGIKGGRRAEVTGKTKRIILESANFDPTYIRKISTALGVRSDSSRRFENGLSPYWVSVGMDEATEFFASLAPALQVSKVFDSSPVRDLSKALSVRSSDINAFLGTSLGEKYITDILERLEFTVEADADKLSIRVPAWRQDIVHVSDVVEEVGRIEGYGKLKSVLPRKILHKPPVEKVRYYSERIRDFLVDQGFSEVLTYSFRKEGVYEVLKSLASDKSFLRADLTKNIAEALEFNLLHAPLLNLIQIKIFEIGKVFDEKGEKMHLCIGITQPKGLKGKSATEHIRAIRDHLVSFLGVPLSTVCTIDDSGGIILLSGKPIGTINTVSGILELDLDEVVHVLPEPQDYDAQIRISDKKYQPISAYPFIVRDVAVYARSSDTFAHILKVIHDLKEEGKLADLEKEPTRPFDEFVNQKLGKKSYAFRLVFQSHERTLTDAEVNASVEHLYLALKARGWQIR